MFTSIFITALAATAVLADPLQRRQTSVDIASLQSAASALEAITSDEPTLPPSVISVLATAVPTSILTDPNYACEAATATPAWYKSLPADVKSALTSYESAAASWYREHSSVLAQFTSAAPAICSAATNAAKTAGGAAGTAATATGTGASGNSGSATIATGSGNAALAARPTGLVAAGLAGAVGVLGLAIAL